MPVVLIIIIVIIIYKIKYRILEKEVLKKLGFKNWSIVSYYDKNVIVKSRPAFEGYDDIKFLKENKEMLEHIGMAINNKNRVAYILKEFLKNGEYKKRLSYRKLAKQINKVVDIARSYRICIKYITPKGNHLDTKEILITQSSLNKLKDDPTLLMGKAEYNRFLKEKENDVVRQKRYQYYEMINKVIDYANKHKEIFLIKGSVDQLDNLITQLFDRTVNSIKKIKFVDSEEWQIVDKFIAYIYDEIKKIKEKNQKILDYYDSSDFVKIKETCETLMSTQREFNEYIEEKVKAISNLFGTRVVRSETINDDEYHYIRPYKKTITPFSVEVSAAVFASAENNPLEYIIKNFYSDKFMYPEQIRKLRTLIEELSTLKDAKVIIENYKKDYQLYIKDVPEDVINYDEDGFYKRLGFANIDESLFVVEYKFSYTSGGGMVKRSFTVPMTEETIIDLIEALEGKLNISSFTKEQRTLMTNKLRMSIKQRDNFTCCLCGNSIYKEPNLLLEIDHIIPVSKGGYTEERNLQTLCWKCNRAKSNKISD